MKKKMQRRKGYTRVEREGGDIRDATFLCGFFLGFYFGA
jgi:hypothetical protein